MRRWISLCAVLVAPAWGQDAPFTRLMEGEGGAVRLESAIHEFRTPDGRLVSLVGVAHIGDDAFYRELQGVLDAHELVLYEGVAPAWRDVPEGASDGVRRRFTRARITDAAAHLRTAALRGANTASVEGWLGGVPSFERRQIESALIDAWGRPVEVRIDAETRTFEMVSLGADGAPGGSGTDRDIRLSGALPPPEAPRGEAAIQRRLAEAAGLVFQLDTVDYADPSWVNSDATVALLWGVTPEMAVSAAVWGERGGDDAPGDRGDEQADALLGLLSGESGFARLLGSVLGWIGSSERSSFLFRLMLVELLGRADDMMLAGAMGPEMVERLIGGRNAVVLEDLEAALAEPDGPRSIAIFYGAAHLADFERRLLERGHTLERTRWVTAIQADPAEVGIEPDQARAFRGFIGGMIDSQLRAMEAMMAPPEAIQE